MKNYSSRWNVLTSANSNFRSQGTSDQILLSSIKQFHLSSISTHTHTHRSYEKTKRRKPTGEKRQKTEKKHCKLPPSHRYVTAIATAASPRQAELLTHHHHRKRNATGDTDTHTCIHFKLEKSGESSGSNSSSSSDQKTYD